MSLNIIGLVSGKGGVGKTFVAANLAYCASLGKRKILLIDLDIENQGLTGLFAEYLPAPQRGAYDAVFGSGGLEAADLVTLRPNLFFLPARGRDFASPSQSAISRDKITDQFSKLLEWVHFLGFEIAIIDCHGGLDSLSFETYNASDHLLVVTELDRVTLHGTLELLDFYYEEHVSRSVEFATRTVSLPRRTPDAVIRPQRQDHSSIKLARNLHFIFNRIDRRLNYKIFSVNFWNQVRGATLLSFPDDANRSNLYMLPAQSLATQSFSEYPFYCEIMPESILSKKIALLCIELIADAQIIQRWKPWRKLTRSNIKTKITQYASSPDYDRAQSVFNGFALAQIGFLLIFFAVGITNNVLEKQPATSAVVKLVLVVEPLVGAMIAAMLLRLDLRVSSYLKEQSRYLRRSSRLRGGVVGPGYLFKLLRIYSIKAFTLICAALMLFLAFVMVVMPIVYLTTGKF